MTILAVDDDATSRMLTRATLEDHLGTVVEAENGLIGVEALEKQDFDLAIVDLDMPVMDGFGLIERARARPETRHLPIIVVTGRDDVVAIERAFALGATSFLCKPINWNVFRHQVSYVLQVAQREREARDARQKAEQRAAFQERATSALAREVDGAIAGICATFRRRLAGFARRHRQREHAPQGRAGASAARSRILTRHHRLSPGNSRAPATLATQAVRSRAGAARRGGRDRESRSRVSAATDVLCDRALAADGARGSAGQRTRSIRRPGQACSSMPSTRRRSGCASRSMIEGPGIPEHMLAAGFEAFAGHAAGEENAGLGIGLPMAKAILARHGGHFGIMSEPGRGTEVFLSFPGRAAADHGEGALKRIVQKSPIKLSETAKPSC